MSKKTFKKQQWIARIQYMAAKGENAVALTQQDVMAMLRGADIITAQAHDVFRGLLGFEQNIILLEMDESWCCDYEKETDAKVKNCAKLAKLKATLDRNQKDFENIVVECHNSGMDISDIRHAVNMEYNDVAEIIKRHK